MEQGRDDEIMELYCYRDIKRVKMKNEMDAKKFKFPIRRIMWIVIDIISIGIASFLAIAVRFNSIESVPQRYLEVYLAFVPFQIVSTILIFYFYRIYHCIWKYASISELLKIVYSTFFTTIIHFIVLIVQGKSLPRSYWLLFFMFLVSIVGGVRFFYRAFLDATNKRVRDTDIRIMVIGAGEAGNAIIKEIQKSKHLDGKVVCLIDDDPNKARRYIQGVKVVGNRDFIISAVEKYKITDIIIAIPSLSKMEQRSILSVCKETSCVLKTLPGMYQLINEEVSVSTLRTVEIEDLLGRDQISLDLEGIVKDIQGKVILVTGGGGSIGSELCRQIAGYNPKQLIILDIYENSAYDIQQELVRKYPLLDLEVLIASVRNEERINRIFNDYRPDVVYHAAAHKHVPLMEKSPHEAIKNNVFGSLNVVKAADQYGCRRFVLISTDKAVNPTNIMGASKRLCEMIVQSYDKKSKTDYVAVRFGNVLGSNGSVIPLFKNQIAHGGPVTVTHPDIIRYFMTIPEAVSLVIQAGIMAKGGEIFVLDMGEPVKIDDLAKNLIRLSGYVPNQDIMIEYTGLRPGEKLFEELLMAEEGLVDTENNMIHVGQPIQIDEDEFEQVLIRLYKAAYDESSDIKQIVASMVLTYKEEANNVGNQTR